MHVFGSDQETLNKTAQAAHDYGAQVDVISGRGEFVGTTKEDGTDREQRDDARRAYDQVIRSAAAAKELPGRDVGKVWDDVRTRWSAFSGEANPEKLSSGEIASRLAAADKLAASIPETSHIDTPERQALRSSITTTLYEKDIVNQANSCTMFSLM